MHLASRALRASRVLLLLANARPTFGAAMAGASGLTRTLTRATRPLIVEITQDDPTAASKLDVEELSASLRNAGAAAMLVPPALLSPIISEQSRAKGDFPGPLPVLCNLDITEDADSQALVKSLGAAGADGVAVRCEASSIDILDTLAVAVNTEELLLVVIAADAESRVAAVASGAAVVVCDYEDAAPTADNAPPAGSVVICAWDGEDETLQTLRDAGFGAMILVDGCGGDIASGAAWCESRVRAFQSKASKQWGGSMFGATNDDVAPPSVRNPRMWAQSQRQAREVMHESARSRGLPAPKIARNTVVGGKGL